MRLADELCWWLHGTPDDLAPLERRLLCILGACRDGAQHPDSALELAGPLQHLALVKEIVAAFADGDRIAPEPERLAKLTGIPEATVLALWPHLHDVEYRRDGAWL